MLRTASSILGKGKSIRPYRIVFCGLDTSGLIPLLSDELFKVVGIAVIPELLPFRTWNPANWMLSLAYRCAGVSTLRWARTLLLAVCRSGKKLITEPYRRYLSTFESAIFEGARLLDFRDFSAVASAISSLETDLLILDGWSILPTQVLEAPKHGTVNIHPSKLPNHRGALPTLWTLKNSESCSAVTFLQVGKGMDDGPILSQVEFPVEAEDTSSTLEKKVREISLRELRTVVIDFLDGRIAGRPQSGKVTKTGSWEGYKKIYPDEETARETSNKILHYPEMEPFAYACVLVGRRWVDLRSHRFFPGDHGNAPSVSVRGMKLVINAGGAN